MPVKCEEWLSLLRDDACNACNMLDAYIKLQRQTVTTSDKARCTPLTLLRLISSSAAIERVFSNVKLYGTLAAILAAFCMH